MNYIGCSIIGDKKYKLNENFRDNENFLKLHSYIIKFPNQDFVKAPLPVSTNNLSPATAV